MAASQESLEEHVTCSICMDMYEDPIALPCMHSFCRHCVKGIIASSLTLKCPECRLDIKLDKRGIDGLPKNFQLGSIVDSYKKEQFAKTEPQRNRASLQLKPGVTLCPNHRQPCELTCRSCKRPVCVQCLFDKHRGHMVKLLCDLEEGPVVEGSTIRLAVCGNHGRPFKLYCDVCDQIVCVKCLEREHDGHTMTSPGEAYKTSADLLEMNLRKLTEKQSGIKKTQKAYRALAQQTQGDVQKHRQELSRYFGTLRDLLDKREHELQKDLDKKEKQIVSRYMVEAESTQRSQEEMAQLTDDIKMLMTEDKIRFLQVFKSTSARVSTQLAEAESRVQRQPDVMGNVKLLTCALDKDVAKIEWAWPKDIPAPAPVPKPRRLSNSSNQSNQSQSERGLPRRGGRRQDPVITLGQPVQRGKDWQSGNIDGGLGHFGQVIQTTIDRNVFVVRWPNGNTGSYECSQWHEEIAPP